MEFVHPFPSKKPGDEITEQELVSAVRLSLCAEEEAVHLYKTIAEFAKDEKVRELLNDIAAEEQVHIGEFQALLRSLEGDETELLQEGEDEAEEKMGTKAWLKGNCKFAYEDPGLRQLELDRKNLKHLLFDLDPLERKLLVLGFGLSPKYGQWTIKEMAKHYKLTPSQVRRMLVDAVRKLKDYAKGWVPRNIQEPFKEEIERDYGPQQTRVDFKHPPKGMSVVNDPHLNPEASARNKPALPGA